MRRNREEKQQKPKKRVKLRLIHLGIILGAAIYFIWRNNCLQEEESALDGESGLEGFDDYY